MGRKGDDQYGSSKTRGGKGKGRKKAGGGSGSRRQDRNNAQSRQDKFMMNTDQIFCQEIGTDIEGVQANPLKGLRLRMWDFSQCDPKRCTGARLARRGIFQSMPLKQPFKGLVLSPNGSEPVSPTDVEILEQHGLSVIDCSWAR